MDEFPRHRILVLPDHPTPLSLRTHVADPVPYVLYSNEYKGGQNKIETFDETSARRSGHYVQNGHELIERFLNS
jgi:2,3-bisphosphoglycerate-independent phosphoglycerate mutase